MKNFILLIFTFLSLNSIYSQTTACNGSAPICSIGSLPSTATTSPNFGQLACLGSTANGNWYTIKSAGSGLMTFSLHQGNNPPLYNNRDVDFVCWGPFTTPPNCSSISLTDCPSCPNNTSNPGFYPFGNIIDCSYDAASTETLTINAQPDEYFLLFIANFSGLPAQFVLEQTNNPASAGATESDCAPVCGVNLGPTAATTFPDPPAINTVSICNSVMTSYTLHCNFENPPANQATLLYKWYWNGVLQPTLTTQSITVTQSGLWKVVVTHPDCGIQSEDSVNIIFSSTPVLTAPATQQGPIGNCNPSFDLTALIPGLFTAPQNSSNYTVTFYTDEFDADSFVNPIPNPSNFSVTTDTTIWVRAVSNSANSCVDNNGISFLLDVICDASATGNVICAGSNTGQLTFVGAPNAIIDFNDGTNFYNIQLNASGTNTWTEPSTLFANATYYLTNVAVGSPVNNTPLYSTATISVIAQPVVTSFTGTTAICSGSSTNLTFTGTPNATVTYSDGVTTPNPTILLDGTTGIGTVSVSPTVNTTYSLVSIATSGTPVCTNPASGSVSITVNNPPIAGSDGNTLVCETSTATIDLYSLITGEQPGGVWTRTGTGTGGTFDPIAGTFIPAVGATTSTFVYTLTGVFPCGNDDSEVTVNIYAQPDAGADGNTLVCETSTATIDLFSLITGEQPGGVWTRTGTGTGGTFDPIAGTFIPAVGATTSTFAYTLTGVFPCVNDDSEVTVNIYAQPDAGTDGNTSVCETSTATIDLFSLITGEQSGGVWTRIGTGTGGTFDPIAGTFIPAVGATTSTFAYTLTGTAPCIDDSSLATVNINAQPNAGTDATTTVCASSTTPIDLFSLITGEQAGGVWTRTTGTGGTFNAATGSFTPSAGATNSTFTYELTGTFPCVNDTSVATVNFSAQPNAGTDGSIAICDNSTATIDLYSLITGEQAGGTWVRTSGTGGIFDPIAGTFTPAVGANTSKFTYTLLATSPCVSDSSEATVTISAIPTNVTISGSTTTCAGIPVDLTVTGTPGTLITWTGVPSSFVIGVSGSNVISVSPTLPLTSYTLTSASLNGCTIPVIGQSATVTVSATPQFITQIPDFSICNGGTLNIASQLTSTVPGTTFVWSATTSNVSTAVISGDETNIDQIVNLINTISDGTINIVVRPQVGICLGTSQDILVTVKPIPAITSTVADKTVICNNESVIITSISNPVATMYNWQINTATGVQIVGGVTSGTSASGIVNLQLALTNPLVAGTISFNFTPVNGICTGATIINAVTITVNPIPGTPIGLPIDEICSGETTNLTISSFPNIAGTTLEWTVIDSQNVTGFVNGTGIAPFTINDVLVNTSNVQGFVKYSVTSKLGNCAGGTTEYIVRVNPLPKPDLIDGHICVNESTGVTYQGYVLDAQLADPNFTYDWFMLNTVTNTYDALPSANGSTYEATQPGTYQVTVTNTVTNCKQTDQATVITVYPAIAFTSIVTEAFTNDATITITVNPVGTGSLIYSLDGGAWQNSNIFTGVEAGTHQITVEDTEGCTHLTETVEVIDYPKYFTPNGDGIHDYWKIVGLEAKHNAKIYIFDRYGKLIKQIDPLGDGWDGKFNGQNIPSTDYWFKVDYTENNQQKQFKAHFSLKR